MKLLLGAALLASSALPAFGQACAPRDNVLETLRAKYGETRQMAALDANHALTEVWANLGTGTWTITTTTAMGRTCLVASGANFETYAEAPGIDG